MLIRLFGPSRGENRKLKHYSRVKTLKTLSIKYFFLQKKIRKAIQEKKGKRMVLTRNTIFYSQFSGSEL